MKDFVVLYILYPNLENPTHVLYLRKNPKGNAPKILWNRLVGIGGGVEEEDISNNLEDTIFNATIREIKEELEIIIDKKNLVLSGKLYRIKQHRNIYFLKTAFDKKIDSKNIANEGKIAYFEIDYHKKKPNEFPPEDGKILDKVFFENQYFEESLE